MVRCGRLASLGMVVGLVVGGAIGCGGDDKTKTIEVPVQPGETAQDWQQRALTEGLAVCSAKNPPETVVFTFDEEDEKTEVAAEVEKQKVPTSAACSGFQQTTGSANP